MAVSSILQATDLVIEIYVLLNDSVPTALSEAKCILYNKSGIAVTKTLANGLVYVNGKLEVFLSEVDTTPLVGTYTVECLVRTDDGTDFFALPATPLTFVKTIARI